MSKNRLAGPIIAVVIVIVFVLWMLSGSKEQTESAITIDNSAKSLTPTVQVVPSVSREVQQVLAINGTTKALRHVTVRSEVSGKVLNISKSKGDSVNKGDIITQLDTKDIPTQINQAKAYEQQTRLEYEGALKLANKGLLNEAQTAAAFASHEQAKASLASLQLTLANASIRAPFAGLVEATDLEIGSFVSQGDAIAEVYDYAQLKFEGSVSEKDVSSLSIGQKATVELVNGDIVPAKISYIGTVANASTRTFIVELIINNGHHNISGVTSVAHVNLKVAQGHYVSPALLYINNDGLMGLKTIDSSNTVQFNEVEIIHSDTNGVWVRGLPDTANIIIVGQGFVNVNEETSPTIVEFNSDVAVGL